MEAEQSTGPRPEPPDPFGSTPVAPEEAADPFAVNGPACESGDLPEDPRIPELPPRPRRPGGRPVIVL